MKLINSRSLEISFKLTPDSYQTCDRCHFSALCLNSYWLLCCWFGTAHWRCGNSVINDARWEQLACLFFSALKRKGMCIYVCVCVYACHYSCHSALKLDRFDMSRNGRIVIYATAGKWISMQRLRELSLIIFIIILHKGGVFLVFFFSRGWLENAVVLHISD